MKRQQHKKTARRYRLVAFALNLTADTWLAPDAQEIHLLEQYAQGASTLNQTEARIEAHHQQRAANKS